MSTPICRSIIANTLARDAPSAIRTPISCVRCATRYAITPYSPADVRISASSANAATSHRFSRRGATESAINRSIVNSVPNGWSRSISAIAARNIGAIVPASDGVRTTSVNPMVRPICCRFVCKYER